MLHMDVMMTDAPILGELHCTGKERYISSQLNKDYSKHPTQVLMKHSIPELLITEINKYNAKYGTNFGYNCGSLFALKQLINEKG